MTLYKISITFRTLRSTMPRIDIFTDSSCSKNLMSMTYICIISSTCILYNLLGLALQPKYLILIQ
jgi:hypothetical protein